MRELNGIGVETNVVVVVKMQMQMHGMQFNAGRNIYKR